MELWAIQEHHLDARGLRKQWFKRRSIFYGEGVNGFSGVLSIVKRELDPRVVYNNPLGRVLGL